MNAIRTKYAWIAAAAVLALCPAAWAQTTDAGRPKISDAAAKKAEFNRLVVRRNQLAAKLGQLDRQAAQAVKAGRDPVQIHAEQISTQDQLDLTTLRLETLAMRHDFIVPAAPEEKADPAETDGQVETRRTSKVFQRGRDRTAAELKRQTLKLLRSIDYGPFLKAAGTRG